MDRRRLLSVFALVPVGLALAACGDSKAVSVDTDGTIAPATTVAPPTTIPHPMGADDVVLKITDEGGLVPPDYLSFYLVPQLLVTGDGRAFRSAPASTAYPGPLLPNILVEQAGEVGVQAWLHDAEQFGLLAPAPDYSGAENVIADGTSTVFTINANGEKYVHSAYALGILDPETGARKNFQNAIATISAVPGDGIPGTTFVATSYRLRARPVDPSDLASTTDQPIQPIVVDWPEGTSVELAAATDCARVAASAVGTLFIDAYQNTFFRQHGAVYSLVVRGVLPGDPVC
jgi:hypothetical protein